MNFRLRAAVDLAILLVVALLGGLLVRFTDVPQLLVLVVVSGFGSGLAVLDVMRAGMEGRPLWRWKWLDQPRPPRVG